MHSTNLTFLHSVISFQGLILLIHVKIESKMLRNYRISENSSRKIQSNIVRMSIYAILMVMFFIITFVYHIYTFGNMDLWSESLQNYIL